MATGIVDATAAWVLAVRKALHPGPASAQEAVPTSMPPLRIGVERGMAATLAVVASLLVVLALPDFIADHLPGATPLVALSLCLAGSMLAALPLALLERPGPVRAGLWIPVAAYVGLLVLESFHHHDGTPATSTPWLVGLSLIAFSCTAVAEVRPARAVAICVGIDTALTCVYADRLSTSHSLLQFVALGLFAIALVAGVRVLRVRADEADAAETHAQQLFEEHQRQVATEAERVHTDALLHDTVLASLLAAAGNQVPGRAADMARSALDIVSDLGEQRAAPPATVTFGEAVDSAGRELAPFHGLARIDLTGACDVRLPPDVAEALLSATLQALVNSAEHAGPSALRTVVATRLDDGGLAVTVSDDGAGFDLTEIPRERLGVRVSIVERMRLVGGSAVVRSAPGGGTTVSLAWHPADGPAPGTDGARSDARRPGQTLLELVPRRTLYRLLGVVIIVAVVIATVDAVVVTHAYGSVVASVLGLTILPTLVRGARRGVMSDRAAWGTTVVSCLLCCVATIGLDPEAFDYVTISRYTCGVLAGAGMGWMAGRRLPPLVAVAFLVGQIALWAGPEGVIRLGLAVEIVVVIAALLMHRALREITAAAHVAAEQHRALTIQQTELDAFHRERQRRLHHAERTAAPMLRQIVDAHGELDEAARAECRVLEQALRDEIRGRSLLNDAVRAVVSAHRRRGALVQVLDDGGLDGTDPEARDALLDDVARRLEPVRSSRIVLRTGQPDSDTAVTVVASTPDETAAALGLDADDEVDLWLSIPRSGALARRAESSPEEAPAHREHSLADMAL